MKSKLAQAQQKKNIKNTQKKRAANETLAEPEEGMPDLGMKKREEYYDSEEDDDEELKNMYLGPDDWVMKVPQHIRPSKLLKLQEKLIEEDVKFEYARISGRFLIIRSTDDLSKIRLEWENTGYSDLPKAGNIRTCTT
ncbi:hypothetical protein SeMB42_g01434 [Synchytrium endobioticum]|uniref:Uncharacterized protein n=1 Tax=Synchytrium endobioticum TaxID=286115 RepID=A0A507DCP6_9FUNG|nr:hypothetical protein SeLEV6574_g01533 [Synchytrium endobioticum]TPX52448.1 hypothetical protein SeMB42_g01434 [Synchytrium endobioticum]